MVDQARGGSLARQVLKTRSLRSHEDGKHQCCEAYKEWTLRCWSAALLECCVVGVLRCWNVKVQGAESLEDVFFETYNSLQ